MGRGRLELIKRVSPIWGPAISNSCSSLGCKRATALLDILSSSKQEEEIKAKGLD